MKVTLEQLHSDDLDEVGREIWAALGTSNYLREMVVAWLVREAFGLCDEIDLDDDDFKAFVHDIYECLPAFVRGLASDAKAAKEPD